MNAECIFVLLIGGKWQRLTTYSRSLVWTDFYKLADSLHKRWDDKYTKLLSECSSAHGSAADMDEAKATLAVKRSFAKSLFSISKEDLGRILVEVEAKCPAAIVRNAAEDEVDLNVDKIAPSVLSELIKFVEAAKKKKKAAPPAKKAKTG